MLELLGALLLSAFAVALAVLGIGVVSEKHKKFVEEKTDGGFASGLKAYGISSRARNQSILEIDDSEKKRMLKQKYAGNLNPSTGDIKLYVDEESNRQHEEFHRGHLIETIAPTKKLRKELNTQWLTNKKNLDEINEHLSQLPENLVSEKIESPTSYDNGNNGNYATAIIDAAKNKEDPLEYIKKLSSDYEREKNSIVDYASYKYAKRKFVAANVGSGKLINEVVESFLNSNSGAEEIELAGYRYLKNSELTCTEMTPKMRESVRKKLTIELRSSLRSKERLDGELFNNFNEFTKEYHNEDIEKLKKLKKSSQEYRDEMDSKLNYVDTHYGAKSNAYFVEALQKYTEHQNVNKSSDVDSSLQKNFSPLTESFAYYLNIQRGDRLKEEAKETLLENGIYAKNNKERLKYEIALRTVFKMHDEVKKYGNLSDEDALKIILPMSKYVRSVDELEKFAGDERNIKELVHYSKIASNMGGDKTDSFGEYRGLQALKHYKNTGKIH